MTMTRQHFEMLAAAIAAGRPSYKSNAAHVAHAADIARVLARTNPRFDTPRFIMACMPRAWVGTAKANPWERAASRA